MLVAGLLVAQENSEPLIDQGEDILKQVDQAASDENTSDNLEEAKANTVLAFTMDRYEALMAGIAVFIVSVFVGFEVITKVPQTLHTPLMSGSNAISGITIVGAILVVADCVEANTSNRFAMFLAGLAIALAMVNVVGGFGVTHRMLSMFSSKKKKKKATQS